VLAVGCNSVQQTSHQFATPPDPLTNLQPGSRVLHVHACKLDVQHDSFATTAFHTQLTACIDAHRLCYLTDTAALLNRTTETHILRQPHLLESSLPLYMVLEGVADHTRGSMRRIAHELPR
jgi:hypothetical protein